MSWVADHISAGACAQPSGAERDEAELVQAARTDMANSGLTTADLQDEAELVQAARTDPEVFGELCTRYSRRLYSYLRARTANDDDAADLTQQVFVKAMDALPRYRERGAPFGAWLFRIAHNLLADTRRPHHATVS